MFKVYGDLGSRGSGFECRIAGFRIRVWGLGPTAACYLLHGVAWPNGVPLKAS